MTVHADVSGLDPRLSLDGDDLAFASRRAQPAVAKAARGRDSLVMVGGGVAAVALGAMTLIAMSHHREPAPRAAGLAPRPASAVIQASPSAAPLKISATAAPAASSAPPVNPNAVDPNQSRANPMIVDNTGGPSLAADRSTVAGVAPAGGAAPQGQTLMSGDEQWSLRVGGADGTAHATGLGNPGYAVIQGTIIPAVLETALNSDLPGYARAIVSRDIRAFNGQRIAIPRGSRLIGQYKSGLATGQSRAFIVWTRLIRPDGASIQLGSPVIDEAGETGVAGQVNRHFVQRFGSAILLSVVGGLSSALGDSSSSTLVIGTSSEAQSAAAQALQTDGKIAPTIRIPLGTPIQVFTARDLDFSGT